MWRFTQNRIVIRKDISTVVKVPAEEVKEILEQMARLKINKAWEFVFRVRPGVREPAPGSGAETTDAVGRQVPTALKDAEDIQSGYGPKGQE